MQTVDTSITTTYPGGVATTTWMSNEAPIPAPGAAISGIPVYLYENCWREGRYSGSFWDGDSPTIELNIPCAWSKADKLTVLFILLHEYAHAKQNNAIGPHGMAGIIAHCAQDAHEMQPLEQAANKYAMNSLIRLGILPGVIEKRLQKAGLGENVKAGWTR